MNSSASPDCLDENTAVEFVRDLLAPEARNSVEAHIDTCTACRLHISELVKALEGDLATASAALPDESAPEDSAYLRRGATLDRYVILSHVGKGGMGVVYAAYDPELDRRVALKLLRPELSLSRSGDDARARLLREAQAMARLSHPNVVTVHDVGKHGDQLFVAMEFVEGATLRQWLRERRAWRDTLALFLQAGRGLAGAHAVGLVHRDFKPENVLCGADGRIRVTDFGLAYSNVKEPSDAAPPDKSLQSPLTNRITKEGSILGTPAYMAPEQLSGGATDARTDQFSFCVALYEALFGEHPFGGDSLPELAERVLAGRIKALPAGARIPDRVRIAILRGLSVSPNDRHPSMEALLETLTLAPTRKRRFFAVAAGAILMLAAATWWGIRQRPALLCKGAEKKLSGIWDGARKQKIHSAFTASGSAFAEDTWNAVERALDSYTRSWVAMRIEACEATRVRGDQSEELLDRRMQCLDDRLSQVGALASLLSTADARTVGLAVSAAEKIDGLDSCADTKLLKALVALPADPNKRKQIAGVQAELANQQVLFATESSVELTKSLERLTAESEKLGYAPLRARVLSLRGVIATSRADNRDARALLGQALMSAEAGGDDEQLVLIWNSLMRTELEDDHFNEAEQAREHAQAFRDRMPSAAHLQAELDYTTGVLLMKTGKGEQARDAFQRALSVWEKEPISDSRKLDSALGALSNVAELMGDSAEAVRTARRALEISENALGRWHPDLVGDEETLGNALSQTNDPEARAHLQRALEVAERSLPPDHPLLAEALGNWAGMLIEEKHAIESEAAYRRVLQIQERKFGPDHSIVGQTLTNLAGVLIEEGKLDAAEPLLARALAVKEHAFGPMHYEVALTLGQLAKAAYQRKDFARAVELGNRALAVFAKTVEKNDPRVLDALEMVGQARLEQHDATQARALLERAVAIRAAITQTEYEKEDLAHTRFALARALWESGERARALELARAANDVLAKGPVKLAVNEWLARHGAALK